MLGIVGSVIGLSWLAATVLLARGCYHHLRGARAQAARDRARAGWLAAAAVTGSLITIAAGRL